MARTPIPMMIRRKVSMPLRQARSQITSDVRIPPAIAVKVMAVRCWPNSTIATSTPLQAPVFRPITSGLPSGLRISDWKIAPLTPSAAPTRIAIATRGSRHSVTTRVILRGALPVRAWKTCTKSSVTAPLCRLQTASITVAITSRDTLVIKRRVRTLMRHLRVCVVPGRSAPARR
ncbi:Uncharacterised protein [Enterobacter kobei]|nr:Uncharacterised protein [Enterobacter kobei]